MLFGQNPTYLYGEVYNSKFSTPEKAYPVEELPVKCTECPAKLVNGKIEIFFSGPIFNTYVLSVEENVCVLKSYDDKITIIHGRLPEHQLVTVKTVKEDDNKREVAIFTWNELFPGYMSDGTLSLDKKNPVVTTPLATGSVRLQNNEQKPNFECLLYKIENNEYSFVEINNPVERTTVNIVKDMRGTKIGENGFVRGVVLNCSAQNTAVSVYAKRVLLGRYIFVEDINEGTATVDLVGKIGQFYKVEYKGFTGICRDKKVSKKMKGIISNIKGNMFDFTQRGIEESELDAPAENIEKRDNNELKVIEKRKNNDVENTKVRKTEGFEETVVSVPVAITSEDQIEDDQLKAVAYIKHMMEQNTNVVPLFKKYMMSLKNKDYICLAYIKYLVEKDMLDEAELRKTLRLGGAKLSSKIADAVDITWVHEYIYKNNKSKKLFFKLLEKSEDKEKFIKDSPLYMDAGIEFVYKNMKNPRVTVEKVIDGKLSSWKAYLNCEKGDYKRAIFRRMADMSFKKDEMKEVFRLWLEFEESANGNVDEVKERAREYVAKTKSTV
ncbi:hypothetical protein ENBRE01_2336 [Enteropsectra breve]|nr:hypothetical protein ENBRE01_2336 [Enteropsectra breve]